MGDKLLGAGAGDRSCQRSSSEEQGEPGATPRPWRDFSKGGRLWEEEVPKKS